MLTNNGGFTLSWNLRNNTISIIQLPELPKICPLFNIFPSTCYKTFLNINPRANMYPGRIWSEIKTAIKQKKLCTKMRKNGSTWTRTFKLKVPPSNSNNAHNFEKVGAELKILPEKLPREKCVTLWLYTLQKFIHVRGKSKCIERFADIDWFQAVRLILPWKFKHSRFIWKCLLETRWLHPWPAQPLVSNIKTIHTLRDNEGKSLNSKWTVIWGVVRTLWNVT